MSACPTIPQSDDFIGTMLRFMDCQAQTIGTSGYQALATPGSTFSLILTSFLTLFVALFGYRMLFGHVPTVRDGVLSLAKIGFVLALATSWPAYRTLVYDVALHGPAELASNIGGAAGIPGARGGLASRLDQADRGFVALSILGAGPIEARASINGLVAAPLSAPPPFDGFNAFALGSSRILYLISTIGGLAVVRLIAGLLLALGPFFIAFILFDATRGLFEGWLRVLIGATLAAAAAAIILGVELTLLEPWLSDLLARRSGGQSIPAAPTELLVVTTIFGLAIAAAMSAIMWVAMGLRLPSGWSPLLANLPVVSPTTANADARPSPSIQSVGASGEGRSRAIAVADAVAASQRREVASAAIGTATPRGASPNLPFGSRDASNPLATRLGQGYRHSSRRVSASAGRRDRS